MSTRHEVASQRGSLGEETESDSSRPLSSSFFAPIDHSVPARQSSLHLYPQHTFPSKQNKLDNGLEVPYAFSHRHAAFHWTEDDALQGFKLNFWAKPACLNCELAGEGEARWCDRHTKQEDSEGQIRCCSRCKRDGADWSCIEQVEIRADGNYGRVVRHALDENDFTPSGDDDSTTVDRRDTVDSMESAMLDNVDFITVEFDQWCREEQQLRRKGLVWWQPINLNRGDVGRKEQTVKKWQQRDTPAGIKVSINERRQAILEELKQIGLHQWETLIALMDDSKTSWESGREVQEVLEERMSLCKQINQELIAGWNMEEGDLKREAEQAEADVMFGQPADDHSFRALDNEKTYWVDRIRTERTRQYHADVEAVGQDVANLSQRAWEAREDEVISQACLFLERKKYWMLSGALEHDAIALSKIDLSGEMEGESDFVNDLEDLVLGMFRGDL